MTDSSEIGRFGTLRLLKRHDPHTTVAFFPVDDEEVTFGRSTQCSIRLYYAFVSEVHCILRMSDERKAFLIVKGANGVTIDGCEVIPTPNPTQHPIVPLTNGSEIEIHTKKFKFEYPPKEIRAALLATPRTSLTSTSNLSRRRSLRMSMIASAQVFTPQKSSSPLKTHFKKADEADRWDVLKSPVKAPFLSEEPEMTLIQGSGEDAVVVEEEKDLIILEHVEDQCGHLPIPIVSKTPNRLATTKPPTLSPAFPIPTTNSQEYKTPPPNRRRSGVSLHRAVVLRSAHRAYLEHERQRDLEQAENEQEEEEVEIAVSPERDLGPFELCEDDEDEDSDEGGKETREDDEDARRDEEGEVEQRENEGKDKGEEPWGKNTAQSSLYDSHPYRGPSETVKRGFDIVKKLTFKKSPEGTLQENNEKEDAQKFYSPSSPARRTLTNFMTPQAASSGKLPQRVPVDVAKPRQTLAGGELFTPLFGGARRVPMSVPLPPEFIKGKATTTDLDSYPRTSQKIQGSAKSRITQEEHEAILERRRSALLAPTAMLPFPGSRPSSLQFKLDDDEDYMPGRDDNEDSATMLEKMKVKLEGVQRRNEARKAGLNYTSPRRKENLLDYYSVSQSCPHLQPSSPLSSLATTGVKSRTLRMAEASLRQMKLEDDETEVMTTPKIRRTLHHPPHQTPMSLGKREVFSNERWMTPPATKLYPQTPSFVGLRDMFKIETVMATPDMKLDEVFDDVNEPQEHEEVDHSEELQVLEVIEVDDHVDVKPPPSLVPVLGSSTLIKKTATGLPLKRGARRKILERTSPDVDAQPTTSHFMSYMSYISTKVIMEPFREVPNNLSGDEDYRREPPDQPIQYPPAPAQASTKRVTRSRNTKSVADEETKLATVPMKRVTRQTKKQQMESNEESGTIRRGGHKTAKPSVVQVKQGDDVANRAGTSAPKSTQRRKARLK